jgi:hypothetical protein
MIYTHVINQGGQGVRSPADFDIDFVKLPAHDIQNDSE